MENEIKSNWRMTVEVILIYTLSIAIISNLSWLFLEESLLKISIIYHIYTLFTWPYCILTGFVIALVIAYCRRTILTISEGVVKIKRFGKLLVIPQRNIIRIQAKNIRVGYYWFVYTIRKKYIVFYDGNGNKKKHRLYDFNEKDIEEFFEKWRYQESQNTSLQEKAKSKYEAQQDPCVFKLKPEQIIKDEKKSIMRIAIIELMIAISGVFLILITKGSEKSLMPIVGLVISLLAIMMLLFESIRIYHVNKRGPTCPRDILYKGTLISFDDADFNINEIVKITMTSPRKKSDSIYPTHYFISFELQDMTKIKFWIGSESSFADYSKLCDFIASSMMSSPKKLNFK